MSHVDNRLEFTVYYPTTMNRVGRQWHRTREQITSFRAPHESSFQAFNFIRVPHPRAISLSRDYSSLFRRRYDEKWIVIAFCQNVSFYIASYTLCFSVKNLLLNLVRNFYLYNFGGWYVLPLIRLSINSVFNTYAIADVILRHFTRQQKAVRK